MALMGDVIRIMMQEEV